MNTSLTPGFTPVTNEDHARRSTQLRTMFCLDNLHALVKHARAGTGKTRKDLYLTWYRVARWSGLGRIASFSLARDMGLKAQMDIPLPSTLETLGTQSWAKDVFAVACGE